CGKSPAVWPYQASTISPFDLNTRTLRPSCISLNPTRSAFLVCGLNRAILDMSMGMSLSTIPPVWFFIGFGRWCLWTPFTPSTTGCLASPMLSTVPRFPLSLPAVTMTSSPFLIFSMVPVLEHFRRERHDLHEALGAQLSRHRSEDACSDGFQLRR